MNAAPGTAGGHSTSGARGCEYWPGRRATPQVSSGAAACAVAALVASSSKQVKLSGSMLPDSSHTGIMSGRLQVSWEGPELPNLGQHMAAAGTAEWYRWWPCSDKQVRTSMDRPDCAAAGIQQGDDQMMMCCPMQKVAIHGGACRHARLPLNAVTRHACTQGMRCVILP